MSFTMKMTMIIMMMTDFTESIRVEHIVTMMDLVVRTRQAVPV